MLHEIRRFAQHAIGFERQDRHAAASVVGYQDVLAGLIHSEMTRVRAARCHGVQSAELPRTPVDGERRNRAALGVLIISNFVCGEQIMLRGIHRQERGADGLRR